LWPPSRWNEALQNLKVGIINFRRIPNWTSITTSFAKRPYF
jgi:hypothetical protein